MKGFLIDDAGHSYDVRHIDGDGSHKIRFVKRCGDGYPGNVGSYEGTTLQIVLRILLDRVIYLNKQKYCVENKFIMFLIQLSIWFLEFRAARRHRMIYAKSLNYAAYSDLCDKCGHTVCRC